VVSFEQRWVMPSVKNSNFLSDYSLSEVFMIVNILFT
jgi:hypothetical protein